MLLCGCMLDDGNPSFAVEEQLFSLVTMTEGYFLFKKKKYLNFLLRNFHKEY